MARLLVEREEERGVGLPGDMVHAPTERVVVPLLLTGAEAAAYLWDELASLPGSR